MSFCSDVVADCTVLTVPDASLSPRYAANPLVMGAPHIRGYLGVPLIGRDTLPLGALCVLDTRPRDFTADHVRLLTQLAEQAVVLLDEDRRALADRSAPG